MMPQRAAIAVKGARSSKMLKEINGWMRRFAKRKRAK
jgi:hypothetical protein